MLGQHLHDWAKERGGYAKFLPNMRHLWEELLEPSDVARIYPVFATEQMRASQALDRDYRCDRMWKVAVVKGRLGFQHPAGGTMGDAVQFLKDVTDIRDHVRIMLGMSEEFPIDYKRTEPLESIYPTKAMNVFGDGYLITFSSANNVPEIGLQAPGTDPELVEA